MKTEPRILFVEDHEDTRKMLTVMLGRQGYDLKTAPSFDEGLRMAREGNFDLFLLDFHFADGTGRELCERIREFDEHTPILFFSGSHPKVQQEALSCGAQGFVLKPDLDTLRTEIRKNLRQAA
jgi:two-component system, OmpR family, manganese sensing response regulator